MELVIYTSKHTIKMDSEDWDLRCSPRKGKPRKMSVDSYGYVSFISYYAYRKYAKLHRLIAERIIGRHLFITEHIDHINGDRLDNRRHNLRVVTQRQNNQNRPIHRNGKLVGCCFDTELEAHEAYVKALENLSITC